MIKTVVLVAIALTSVSAFADKYVGGYMKRDGTYVAPHYQTNPNQYRYDNYSSQGNVNPYTGQRGYERNEFSDPPAYNKSNPLYAPDPYQTRPRRSYGY